MSTSCALDRIPAGYISSYSLVLVVLIDSLTSAWVKRQKYRAGLEDEFVKLKVDTSASGMVVFKSTQGKYVVSDQRCGDWQNTSAHIHECEQARPGQ
jgi:hypothetical protein